MKKVILCLCLCLTFVFSNQTIEDILTPEQILALKTINQSDLSKEEINMYLSKNTNITEENKIYIKDFLIKIQNMNLLNEDETLNQNVFEQLTELQKDPIYGNVFLNLTNVVFAIENKDYNENFDFSDFDIEETNLIIEEIKEDQESSIKLIDGKE